MNDKEAIKGMLIWVALAGILFVKKVNLERKVEALEKRIVQIKKDCPAIGKTKGEK